MTPRKALVLDTSARFRLRVAAVLDEHPALAVLGAVGTVDDALRRSRSQTPDLLVLDADFGHEEGIIMLEQLRAALPDTTIWILTDRGTARGPMAQRAFGLGVQAWLEKPAAGLQALRDVLHPAAEALLAGTVQGPRRDPNQPRRPVLSALKAVPPQTARVRASVPAPPADPRPSMPRPRRPAAEVARVDHTPLLARPPKAAPASKAAEPTPPAASSPTERTPPRPPAPQPRKRPPIPPRPLPPRPRRARPPPAPTPPPPPRPAHIVIGASTGGPEALAHVLAELPAPMDVPVVVVQNMPVFFLRRFAERLHAQGPLPTALAVHGSPLGPGRVWIAPGDQHLEIRGSPGAYTAHLRGGRRLHGCRPAIDVTLHSLARPDAGPAQIVILTGMGRDGAAGAKALLPHGAHVIAQDKETSVVWGMPRAVAEDGTAHAVLPLSRVATAIRQRLVVVPPA
ncbi:MAG: chemotaxis protein CheB [Myxococcota bacterium]|nr:chemotaxis protein CheB [Myxococcota bacterium]